MELVYLWIKKYKNIEKQGFNFSPKFWCEYNPNTEELRIEERDYTSIFSDNINITAIVGKNGSGKSNLVKAIFQLLYNYHFRNENNSYFNPDENKEQEEEIKKIKLSLFEFNKNKFKFFLIIKEDKNFYKIDSEYLKQQLQTKGFKLAGSKKKIFNEFVITYENNKLSHLEKNLSCFSIYYNYSLDSWQDSNSSWIETIYHRKDNYKIPLLLEPSKKDNKINLNLLKNLTNQRILLFYSLLKKELTNEQITSFFNPNKIKFDYAFGKKNDKVIYDLQYEIEGLWEEETASYASKYEPILENINKNYFKIIEKYIDYFEKIAIHDNINFAISTEHLDKLNEILNFYQNQDYKKLNLLYLFFKLLEKKNLVSKYSEFGDLNIDELENEFKNNILSYDSLDNFLKEQEFEEIINNICVDNIKDRYEIKKIVVAIQFHKNKLYETLYKFIEKKEIPIENLPEKDILAHFPAWLDVEFYENEKSLNSLSTGEKFKFQFLIGLLYQLYNLNSKKYSIINIFLDEIELGFHPEWQRKYIDEILYILEKFKKMVNFDKKLHLFFLTHSPFLISDLPKQNIIFLDKDENGKCKVADGLKEKKETFGANIHTLLSDSFFMEDGFIGKFAESKINQVIKYLNGEKTDEKMDDKKAQKIINIIGEPILKKEIQRMLDSKRLEKVNELDEIKKEISKLQERLNVLENEKSNNN